MVLLAFSRDRRSVNFHLANARARNSSGCAPVAALTLVLFGFVVAAIGGGMHVMARTRARRFAERSIGEVRGMGKIRGLARDAASAFAEPRDGDASAGRRERMRDAGAPR